MISSRAAAVSAALAKRLSSSSGASAVTFRRVPRQSRTVLPLQQIRYYSATGPLLKKTDDEEGPTYQTINNTGLSDAEIEKIIEEEEVKMMEELKSRTVENWKPGMRKKPLVVSNTLEEFEYELNADKHSPRWTLLDKRCGALAIKVGMMPVFDEWGVRHPTTVLYVDSNVVMKHKTEERDGYMAVQIAAGQRKRKNVGKSVLGQYADYLDDNENPPYVVREFRVTDEANMPDLYSKIHARHFVPGQNVDVSGISKGKGFQGAMKRHNFKGLPATHGVSKSHRSLGSTGQCQDPGKVFKGKKMAGHMGTERVTTQNLRVVKVDRGRNLLYVIGAVPGNKGSFVEIRDAVKKPLWATDKVLGELDRPPLPTFEFDDSVDGSGEAGHEDFMPVPDYDPLAPDLEDEAA